MAGLGAIGSSAVYHLAGRGARVIGLDLHAPPHTHGSSHGESRIIREAYFEHPSYVPLVRGAYERWAALERDEGTPLLRITGALIVGPPDGEAVAGARRSAEAHRIPHRILDAAAVRKDFPEMRPARGEIGLHEQRAGILAPEACIAAHLRGAVRRGANLRFDEPLLRWEPHPDGRVLVTTPAGVREADALVLAAGSWLPSIHSDLALEVERQVMVWFRPRGRAGRFRAGEFPVFLWETREGVFYGVPDLGNGIKAARHHGGRTAPAVDDLSTDVETADVESVRRFLEARIPDAAGEVAAASVCRYTNTRDGHFLVGPDPEHPGVWVASACSGHGFKFSSVLGALLAEEVTTGQRDPDMRMFGWRTAVLRGS